MRIQRRLRIIPLVVAALVMLVITACNGETTLPDEATETPLPPTVDDRMTPAVDEMITPTADEPPQPTETPVDEASAGEVLIENVAVFNEDGRVEATISGNLPDECTTIESVEQEFSLAESTFTVMIETNRPADQPCAQVLVPFQRSIVLPTAELDPGTYYVQVQSEEEQFELTTADQEPLDATAQISPASGPPGTRVRLAAAGLPANTEVELGVGRQASEFTVVETAMTDADGTLSTTVQIPESADVGDPWAVVVVTPSFEKIASNTFDVTGDQANFDEANIYLVALEDEGQTGQEIGCGDSLIPVEVNFEPTVAPLEASLEQLLAIDEEYYGQSGLYNALHRSNFSVQGIDIVDGHATIALTGELSVGGACDAPRVRAQLEATARQFSTVDSVSIRLNGQPLEEILSGA